MVKKVERHAFAAVAGEFCGDLRILLGPVCLEEQNVVLFEDVLHIGGVEHGGFHDLAGDAPVGGEVDEDGLFRIVGGDSLR